MFYLIKLSVLFICVYVVKTTHSCVCTQPLNPQFLCVDDDCESDDNLIHHYCNSNFVIKILVISDRIFSAIRGSFSTKVGYKFKLVHVYRIEKDQESALDLNIVWTSQDSCGVKLKRGRLYIITGSIDKEGANMKTSSCDYTKPVKNLKVNDINFFGYKHKMVDCSQIDQAEILSPDMAQNSTAPPINLDKNDDEVKEVKQPGPQITTRPVMPDKSCYCGPSERGPGLSAINIGLGAANNNGENGWNNINGGLNIAIASGNGNNGNGIGTVNPSATKCVLDTEGKGNGNGGVNIGIASGNYNGGHGWNVGNGGNNMESDTSVNYGGVGGHNVAGNSGNGNGGKNIAIISGNGNGQNGWNIGNGGNNAENDTFNSGMYVEHGGKGQSGKGPGDNYNLGHGGNNVGENSGNGNGGSNWGLWSGNDNGFHGWHTGNGGNNAGDNVGNGVVILSDGENEDEFIAHHSAIGGNSRGNNTGNGKGGSLNGFGSGMNNGISSWNSGNGGNNVGDNSGNGMLGNSPPPGHQRRPSSGRKPGVWTSGVGNGGNNIGSNSGNGFGSNTEDFKEVMNGFILGIESKFKPNIDKNREKPDVKEDKNHIKTLMDEIESENNINDNGQVKS